ncbi:hypothetical protein [Hymenobacter crusticola]|uniref:DUF4468 domain-containing protein n=1 Tax=Hymenobacter crusticola TaxID=1770526 RepID=A0A243W898_9BACT|nr:hypothetical protein [Hymenobacter crusticola]OUJ71392.1 hypothetical protein BXP70_21790 [Hymenobacter crusticola]
MLRLLCFLFVFGSLSGQAQVVSSHPTAVAHGEIELPRTSDTHQVAYHEQVLLRGQTQAKLHARGMQWLGQYSQLPARQEHARPQPQASISSPGAQEYELQVQGLRIPYKLHYLVALNTAEGSYRYTITNFTVELYPDQEHSQSAFIPMEKYLDAVFIPHSNEEQLVAQIKQHVEDCAHTVSEGLKQAMRGTSGEAAMLRPGTGATQARLRR